jgi:hypothetical protein
LIPKHPGVEPVDEAADPSPKTLDGWVLRQLQELDEQCGVNREVASDVWKRSFFEKAASLT